MTLWSIFGLLIVAFVFIRFTRRLGKTLPIIELMVLVAGLQWIIGPIIEYSFPTLHYKYYMYVPEETYMSFVVPAYGVFVMAVFWGIAVLNKKDIPIIELYNYKNYGVRIFLIGVFFDLIGGFLPGTLGFLAFIMSNFKFAGAIILFFSYDARLRKLFYFSLIYLLYNALQNAMFHDLILWSVFFYMFWAIKYQPSLKQIYLTILIGFFSLSTLQTIKGSYRSEVWSGYQGNKVELFVGLFFDALFFGGSNADELSGDINNVRLNQGWIISAIMDEIPRQTPFFNGETIVDALEASFLPRFLSPDKKQAGGQENFMRFTGLPIGSNTSMGISIIGEAYGNYGVLGGIIFMGIWGWIIAKFWVLLFKKTFTNPLFLTFLPIVFLQVIKAETELVVVLNHLIKATIVVLLFFWGTKVFLRWKLSNNLVN
jgi:hypothetical protein